VDCLGLLMGVARELALPSVAGGYLADYDYTEYSKIPSSSLLIAELERHLKPVPVSEITKNNILLFKIDGNAQHLAISGVEDGRIMLVHSYMQARKVIINSFENPWTSNLIKAFKI